MSYTCNSSSPFVKVSKKCQKSVTKDFEIFPGGNSSVRLAVIHVVITKTYFCIKNIFVPKKVKVRLGTIAI